MSEKSDNTPDIRTEDWRSKQLNIFERHFAEATNQIANILGGGTPENIIQE